jgi:urease accessory protein
LAPRSRLIWGDVWLAGRYERGVQSERFQFERIVQDFEVRRAGRLTFRDRFCWDGPWTPADVDWYFGGALAAGSLFVGGPLPESISCDNEGLRCSTFRLDTGETCVRWCGHPACVTAAVVRTAMQIAGSWNGGPGARPWILNSSGLTPNHWFSTAAD